MKNAIASSPSPRIQRALPPRRARGIALVLSAAVLGLAACMQTDPESDPAGSPGPALPEDEARRAGASSTTNWPPELVGGKYFQLNWTADSALKLSFLEGFNSAAIEPMAIEREGAVRLYLGSGIPSLDSAQFLEWKFPSTLELTIPPQWLDSLSQGKRDTVSINLRVESDTLQGWIYGLLYSRSQRKILQTETSPYTVNTVPLSASTRYFRGSVEEVASMLPAPATSDSRISFYIPGTPNFCTAQSDSFTVGPFPKGKYPLRVLRISDGSGSQQGSLVEAWELLVTVVGTKSVYKLGEQVLVQQSQAKVVLRDE